MTTQHCLIIKIKDFSMLKELTFMRIKNFLLKLYNLLKNKLRKRILLMSTYPNHWSLLKKLRKKSFVLIKLSHLRNFMIPSSLNSSGNLTLQWITITKKILLLINYRNKVFLIKISQC